MQTMGMRIAIEGKVYGIDRENEHDLRVTWPDGTTCLNREMTTREACFAVGQRLARHAYGETRSGDIRATNSMVHEITNAVEQIAGC